MKVQKSWALGAALSVLALAPGAKAQDATMDATTTTTTTTTVDSGMTMSAEPTLVTGTVLRYYVDRSGFVTAMDVQTANGVSMVRFGPGMGQRLMTTFPVGQTANVWVQGSPHGTVTRWDVVGLGPDRPAVWMAAYSVSDVDLLDAEPMILAGSKMITVKGKLSNVVTNNVGEVVGLVLRDTHVSGVTRAPEAGPAGTESATGDAAMSSNATDAAGLGDTLVRVPRAMRHIAPGYAGTERVIPLFKNADVQVTGYVEAPRFGVLSRYNTRLASNAIVVNGRAAGPLAFPLMTTEKAKTLFSWDVGGTRSNEEMAAASMGYTVYDVGTAAGTAVVSPTMN